MTDPSPILSYRSPSIQNARWKLARLLFLANALTFLLMGLVGTGFFAAFDIIEIRTVAGPRSRSSSADITGFLVCSVGITLVGALFLYSFMKLQSDVVLAATIVRRCAFGIMAALIAIAIVIVIVQLDALLYREHPPALAENLLALGICAAGLTLLGYTVWTAGRVRSDAATAQRRVPTA